MRIKLLACTAAVAFSAFAAVPALAVTGTIASSDVNLQFAPGVPGGNSNGLIVKTGNVISGNEGSQSFGSGASYASTSLVEPDFIYFKNGNASTGQRIKTVSKTLVDITFENTGDETVTPFLNSQILPAGFGMFVSRAACPDDPSACNPDQGLGFSPARTFNSFRPSSLASSPTAGYELASSSFEFNIYAEDLVTPVYSLSGDLRLLWGGGGGALNTFQWNVGAASSALAGWRLDPSSDDPEDPDDYPLDFVGYSWDLTDIIVRFTQPLAPGDSATLRYETIVTTNSDTDCLGGTRPACLLTYSAFGDPLGRSGTSGGAGLIAGSEAFLGFRALEPSFAPLSTSGINYDQITFQRVVFNPVTGGVSFVTNGTAVPEPANWALMIAGFGLVGATLRQRRRVAA